MVTLNWLALGQCRSPPDHARLGHPLSPGQHELLERLEDLVDYYLLCGEVTLDSLGRASEKLRNLSASIFSLPTVSSCLNFEDITSFLESIRVAFDSFSREKHSKYRSTKSDPEQDTEPAELQRSGKPSERIRVSANACSAKPVIASRIKWKLAPSFDREPYLTDPIVKKAYKDPDFLRKPEHTWPRLGRAEVYAERDEVLVLAGKWDSLGASRLVPCDSIRDDEAVGLFAVAKDAEFDRLILNRTVVNSRSFGYSRFTKTIAPGYLITMIALSPSERLLISSDDLCEFYYTFRVSAKRAGRNAIGIRFHHSEVSHLQCFNPSLHTGYVYVCLGTLAMGDALAVEIAQQSHMNLLRFKAGCMMEGECLQYRTAIPRGPFYELLTIDDHIGLQKVPLVKEQSPKPTRDVEVFERAGKAYMDVGLTAHPGKRQRQASSAVVLGAEVDGLRGRVSAPRSRIVLLSFLTAVIIQKGHATKKLIQGLLGCWTHILLFRRPAFAIVDKLYSEGAALHEDTVFKLSKESKNELLCLCLLAPTLQTNMRTTTPSAVYMMDASPFGGGICRAISTQSATDEFWRRSEQRGFYTKLQQGPGMVLRT